MEGLMKRMTDCSVDTYNKYRRLEQLQDPETRELYLEAVASAVSAVTLERGRVLTAAEIRDIEEHIDILNDGILTGELEFDLLAEHVKRGLPFTEAAALAREEARDIRAEMFDESLN